MVDDGDGPNSRRAPPLPLMKENNNGKSERDFVKLKLRRYPTSSMSDLCEFKMSLFHNGKPEEFWLFVRKFNMTLAASGTLEADANFQYLCTLVRREALRQFDSLSSGVESTETLNVDYTIRGLAQYIPHVNFLSKQKRTMRHGMKKRAV